jgi:hypothetical protein
MPDATPVGLFVYPVKGCRGIALSRARVGERGIGIDAGSATVSDREWMVIDGEGTFVSQRTQARLALIEPRVGDGALALAAPGKAPLLVPLASRELPAREVTVWDSRIVAHDEGDAAAHWLSTFLGAPVRLVRFDPATRRPCSPHYTAGTDAHTAFADGYPVLVIGAASLADLNARLATRGAAPLPMNRFRPNVVLSGLDAYDEDHLDTIAAGALVLRLVKPCTRCQVTTTDQETATVGAEPLATLRGYRNNPDQGGVVFGMNAIIVAGVGSEIALGSRLACSFRF